MPQNRWIGATIARLRGAVGFTVVRCFSSAGRAGAIAVAVAVVTVPLVVQAKEAQRTFDIPAQDLAEALQLFSRQAGLQILFPHEAVVGKRSTAVGGRMTSPQALARLIARQGLAIARYDGSRLVLRAARAAPQRAAPMRSARLRPPEPTPPIPASPPVTYPEIVVSGRMARTQLTDSQYSYSVGVFDRADLDRTAPVSTAALFRQIPGFWVESSGGEASNNVRARGIPTDGFSSIALAENGLTVQYDGGLAYLNTDQSYRIDDTIERVENVRGGPASLFVPNAPGGLVNFITRSGLREEGGRVQVSAGDGDYYRIDGHYAARLSDHWGLMVGGFYRTDGGRRRPGYTADSGGQFRAVLDYANGNDSFTLDLRRLDDRVTFYLPVPLELGSDGQIEPLAGFDPLRDSLTGPETTHAGMSDGGAPVDFDLTQGTHVRLTAITARLNLDLGGGVQWASTLRWRGSATVRNALFPVGVPMTQAAYLASVADRTFAAFPRAERLALRYAADGAPFPADANGNGLVTGANLLSVSVPLKEVISDNRVNWTAQALGSHQLAVGATAAYFAFDFDRYMGTALLEVANRARLLDAVAIDANGTVVGQYTERGFQRYGSIFDRVNTDVAALAFFAADEWQVGPGLRVDFGGRWERNTITGHAAGKTTLDLGDPFTLADDNVLASNGTIIPIRRDYTGFAWSVGVNYQPIPALGLFARYTDSFRLPSSGDFISTPLRTDKAKVPIRMAELGLRYADPHVNLSATAFYTRFERLPFTDHRFDTASNGYVEQTAIAATRTFGLEMEARWKPSDGFDLTLQAAWQDPQYRHFAITELANGTPVARNYSGHQLIRVPRLSLRAVPGITLQKGRLHAELTLEHFTRRYADIANAQILPAYSLVGLNARLVLTSRLSVAINATNLTDTLGLTEGNPRTGSFDTGGGIARHFYARPEFARSLRVSVSLQLP